MFSRSIIFLIIIIAVLPLLSCRRDEVATAEAEEGYVLAGAWGSEGEGDGQFDCPYDLAVAPDGKVYVVDCDNHNVQYFTSDGAYLGKWYFKWHDTAEKREMEAIDQLPDTFWPVGIDVGPDGTVFVANNESGNIVSYTANGSAVSESAGNRECFSVFSPPGEVAVAPNGNYYATGVYDEYIQCFNAGGTSTGSWLPVKYPPYIKNPCRRRIAVASNGDLYVTDFDNCWVRRFTPDGSLLAEWGSRGSGDGRFFAPRGVAVGTNGYVYVVDGVKCNVQYFTSTGSFVGKFGRSGRGKGYLQSPYAVAVAPDGTVYVADAGNYRVQYFRPITSSK